MIMGYLVAGLVFVLGVAAVVGGGADDSPGLQLIGVVLAAGAIVLAVRAARRGRASSTPA
jgi:peptidoglycan/LPS O-acetylase OafA/YrhL